MPPALSSGTAETEKNNIGSRGYDFRCRHTHNPRGNASDDEHLKRIRSLETLTYDPDICKDKTSNEEN